MKLRKYLTVFGCLFTLCWLVALPLYPFIVAIMERRFGIGGILGFFVFQSCTTGSILSGFLVGAGMTRALQRLPQTLRSILLVCTVCLILIAMLFWISTLLPPIFRAFGKVSSIAMFANVLFNGVTAYNSLRGQQK